MGQEYFVARVRAAEQAGLQAHAALQTQTDAQRGAAPDPHHWLYHVGVSSNK